MFTPELIADNATKVFLVGDPDLVRELRFSFERLGIVVTDVDPDGSISVGGVALVTCGVVAEGFA
ncbi:hypothetical protein NY056_07440 [Corynebacterium diphtheriae bv. gravis]|nr:hypothetical protein NY056_07440 [Corynebacterium diphtheriae bv. gravis]